MYQIIITEPAELDIAEATRYIAKELQNPAAANSLLDDIENSIASLKNMPERHAIIKNERLLSLGFRYLAVNNYLVFYIIREDTKSVTIERFLHCRRDWNHIIGS